MTQTTDQPLLPTRSLAAGQTTQVWVVDLDKTGVRARLQQRRAAARGAELGPRRHRAAAQRPRPALAAGAGAVGDAVAGAHR